METVHKKWGSELIIINREYCGKLLTVLNGKWSSGGKYHYHKLKTETFFVIEGTLLLDLRDHGDVRRIYLGPMESLTIEPHMRHRFTTDNEACRFVEFSTHSEDSDSYREK